MKSSNQNNQDISNNTFFMKESILTANTGKEVKNINNKEDILEKLKSILWCEEEDIIENLYEKLGYIEYLSSNLEEIKCSSKRITEINEELIFINNLSTEFLKNYAAIKYYDLLKQKKDLDKSNSSDDSNKFGFVYIIKDSVSNFYKIGKTLNLKQRLNQLKTGNPNISIIASKKTKKYSILEFHLHKKYKHKRIVCEWFNLDENDLEEIINSYNFTLCLNGSVK